MVAAICASSLPAISANLSVRSQQQPATNPQPCATSSTLPRGRGSPAACQGRLTISSGMSASRTEMTPDFQMLWAQDSNSRFMDTRTNCTAQGGSASSSSSNSSSRESEDFNWLEGKDADLWFVLEIASDEELQELADALYGRSLLSPMLKSVANGDGTDSFLSRAVSKSINQGDAESIMSEREEFLSRLESRFFFLSADARGTLTGARPTYRGVLQNVRERLGVECSSTLATEDLEAEIFLHLCDKYTLAEDEDGAQSSTPNSRSSKSKQNSGGSKRSLVRSVLEEGGVSLLEGLFRGGNSGASSGYASTGPATPLKTLRSGIRAALDMSKEELLTTALKGGSAITLSSMRKMLVSRVAQKLSLNGVSYKLASLVVEQGGKVAVAKLEKQVAFHAVKQGVKGSLARYVGLRSAMSFLGPILWGAFLADIVLQSLGTDYARIVRAIYTLAQIRLTRTYGWSRGELSQIKPMD